MYVLKKLPRRPVGMLNMMALPRLNVQLLYDGWFHRALEKLAALGLGLYTRKSLTWWLNDMLMRKKISALSIAVARPAHCRVGARDGAGNGAYPVDGAPDLLGLELAPGQHGFPGVPHRADFLHDQPGRRHACADIWIKVRHCRADGRHCQPLTLCPSHDDAVDVFTPSQRSPCPSLLNTSVF
jgi:hypothetical protein